MGSSEESWLQAGERLLEEARTRFEGLTDGNVAAATVVRDGKAGEVLAELSEDAALIVLQHRDLSRLHRIATGSTVAAVAAHANCPVVSVPPRPHGAKRGVVTVGVHEDALPLAREPRQRPVARLIRTEYCLSVLLHPPELELCRSCTHDTWPMAC